jgi:hypothetical protein
MTKNSRKEPSGTSPIHRGEEVRRKTLPVSVSGNIRIEISVEKAKPRYAHVFDALHDIIKQRKRR